MDNLMNTLGKQSRSAAQQLGQLETTQKDDCLLQMAEDLENNTAVILTANQQDLCLSLIHI